MVIVSTKEALKKAIKNKQFPIRCTGEIAKRIIRLKKLLKIVKFFMLLGVIVSLGGLSTIWLTGGFSAVATGAGLTEVGATVIIALVCMLFTGSIGIYAMLRGKKVKMNLLDGTVDIN